MRSERTPLLVAAGAFWALASAGAAGLALPESVNGPGVTVEFAGRDRDRAELVAAAVGPSREELGRRLGLSLPEAIRVRLLRTPEAFLGISDGKPVELYAGLAYPRTATIHMDARALDRAGSSSALLRTVRHELVHLAVGHTLGENRPPKWFEEGLACLYGSPLTSRDLDRLRGGRVFRLRALEGRFPPNRELMSLAYAQSESVLRFLARERSEEALAELLRLMARGEPFEAALEEATGLDVARLQAEWLGSFQEGLFLRALRMIFSPAYLFMWTALFVVVGFFIVRRRRRRAAELLDEFP
jgi:hypothetical protein